jgi:pimeloyl-ACP methyl ester carboxylesterase
MRARTFRLGQALASVPEFGESRVQAGWAQDTCSKRSQVVGRGRDGRRTDESGAGLCKPPRRTGSVALLSLSLRATRPCWETCELGMSMVKTRYAKSGDVHIAYQVVGEGPVDLVLVQGWVWNVELFWEDAGWSAFCERLASFSRLILFDKRGTGLSDRVSVREMPTLEERMDDVRAVMDAVGSESAFVLGISEGGPMSVPFAASHPERARGLVLYGSFPRITRGVGYPWGFAPDQVEPLLELAERTWGEGTFSGGLLAPSQLPERLPFFARLEREGASPGAVMAVIRMVAEIDVRGVLPSIALPTLIVHRDADAIAPIEGARYMAAQIPGARLVELAAFSA